HVAVDTLVFVWLLLSAIAFVTWHVLFWIMENAVSSSISLVFQMILLFVDTWNAPLQPDLGINGHKNLLLVWIVPMIENNGAILPLLVVHFLYVGKGCFQFSPLILSNFLQ